MRRILPPLIIFLLTFILMEFLSSLWIEKNGNALDKTRGIVVPHQILGWKHAENLSTEFLDKKFTTDENGFRMSPGKSTGKKILFLGPSSTVGWGVADSESYPALLSHDFQVTNAGQIGHSSFQGLKLYETEFSGAKFDYVVIAYGINDVDLNRFYFQSPLPDSEELQNTKSAGTVTLQKMLYRSSLIGVVSKLSQKIAVRVVPPSTYVRVREDEFRRNLTGLIKAVKISGATPILFSTSTHFKTSDEPEITDKQDLVQKRMGRYLEVLREVALAEGVKLADISSWLTGNKDENFVDPVHFSVKGNLLIANGLRDMIR